MTTGGSEAQEAFGALLDTLREGEELTRAGATDEAEAAEGVRFWTHQLRAGLGQFFDNDPLRPRFTQLASTRLLQPWAYAAAPMDVLGPVPHAIYDLAPLDGSSSYRLTGIRGQAKHFSVYLYNGEVGLGSGPTRFGDHLNHHDLVVDASGKFAIEIGPTRTGSCPNFLELEPDVHTVVVRQFFADPARDTPGTYLLERTPPAGPPPRLTDAEVARRLRIVDEYVRFPMEQIRAYGAVWPKAPTDVANEFTVPIPSNEERARRGSDGTNYPSVDHIHAWCHYEIEPDEALVVRMRPPRDEWWAFFATSRLIQINASEAGSHNLITSGTVVVDDDGWATIVASHRDPFMPNWIDVAGRTRGVVMILWSTIGVDDLAAAAPRFTTEVVPVQSLRSRA